MTQPRRSLRPPLVPRPTRATQAARRERAEPRPACHGRPAVEPLYQTSVFEFSSIDATEPVFERGDGYAYVRNGLPNARSLELSLSALEGAEDALATSSGMAAVLCAVLSATSQGDRVLCQSD